MLQMLQGEERWLNQSTIEKVEVIVSGKAVKT